MEQMSFFGVVINPESSCGRVRASVRKDYGPAPEQRAMNLKKLMRKIAFKRRYREVKGVGDNHHYSVDGIIKVHQYLIWEWRKQFPVCTNLLDQFSYWSWMLGESNQCFSFRDCLIADGYTRPDEVIDAIELAAPDWFVAIKDLSEIEQINYLKSMIAKSGLDAPAVRLAA